MASRVRRHPLVAFFILAYAIATIGLSVLFTWLVAMAVVWRVGRATLATRSRSVAALAEVIR